MFRKSFAMMAAALGFGDGNPRAVEASPVDFKPKHTRGKGGRAFTTKATGAAKLKRLAKKRNNIRKRSRK